MAADAVQLVNEQTKQEVFADGYVQIDETPIDYLVPGNGKAKTGYLWVAHNLARGISHFEWYTSRSSQSLQQVVPQEYRGVIQSDAYAGYQSFAQSLQRGDNIALAGCWAHVRRKFVKQWNTAAIPGRKWERSSSFMRLKKSCVRQESRTQ